MCNTEESVSSMLSEFLTIMCFADWLRVMAKLAIISMYLTLDRSGCFQRLCVVPEQHLGKFVTIRESNHGSGVCKEHYVYIL